MRRPYNRAQHSGDGARIGCSVPLARRELIIDMQRIVGIDLKLLELVNNIALVTLRDLARCAGRLDVCGLDHAAEIAVELVARPHCRRWPRSRALDPAAKS
jgi:hypothetical protein